MRLGRAETCAQYSGKLSKDQSMPASSVARFMSSTFSRVSMIALRSLGRVGAMPKPQLPCTAVVTPCQQDGVKSGSQQS